jgi:hypothetical protein
MSSYSGRVTRHSYKGRRDTGRCGLLETGGEDHTAEHLPGKQVRAFRECDQKSCWRQPVPPAKAREPYDNEVVKRWTAEITKTTVTQRDLSLTSACDP